MPVMDPPEETDQSYQKEGKHYEDDEVNESPSQKSLLPKEAVERDYPLGNLSSGAEGVSQGRDLLRPIEVEVDCEDQELDVIGEDFQKHRHIGLLGLH